MEFFGFSFETIGESVRLFIGIGGTAFAILFLFWVRSIRAKAGIIEEQLISGKRGARKSGKISREQEMLGRSDPTGGGGVSPTDLLLFRVTAYGYAIMDWPLAFFATGVMIWVLRYVSPLKPVALQIFPDYAELISGFFFN